MTDAVTLAAVSAVALTEGVKFLYDQAGEALKRWQERKQARTAAPTAPAEPAPIALPPTAFEGWLKDPYLNLEAVGRLEQDLQALRAALSHVRRVDKLDPEDAQLLLNIHALRQAMEAVYGQRIAFKGEPGPPSGAQVIVETKVSEVLGYVAGLRAKRIIGGSVSSRLKADTVGADGEAVGLDVDTIG